MDLEGKVSSIYPSENTDRSYFRRHGLYIMDMVFGRKDHWLTVFVVECLVVTGKPMSKSCRCLKRMLIATKTRDVIWFYV
jgi:hypothetical protein